MAKSAKTLIPGIKNRAECLTACLANRAAKGCQYRKTRKNKVCRVVTDSFENASDTRRATCWRFDGEFEGEKGKHYTTYSIQYLPKKSPK